MTWRNEAQTLRSPVYTNWDFSQTPVLWEAEEEDVDLTGIEASPSEYMLWRCEYAPGEYGASGGNNMVYKHADIDCRLAVEGVAKNRADDIIRARVDSLETYYKNSNAQGVVFDTPMSYLGPLYEVGAFIARDWTLPVRLFTPGPGDELLAGQSSNQLVITQASHGFSAGDWIGYTGSAWAGADATSGSEQAADGVVSNVADTSTFTVTTGDIVKIASHGLTQGALYLSTTAGAATSTEPAIGSVRQYLGKAISADYILVQAGEMTEL